MSIKKRRGNTLAHEAHGFLRERRRHGGRTLRKRFLRMHNGICPGLCDEHRILQYLFSPKEPVQLPRTCGYGRGSYKAPHLRHQSRVHVSHRMAAASHSMVRVFSFTGVLHRTGAPNSPDAMPPCDAGSYRRDAIGGMLPEHISRGRTPPPPSSYITTTWTIFTTWYATSGSSEHRRTSWFRPSYSRPHIPYRCWSGWHGKMRETGYPRGRTADTINCLRCSRRYPTAC
jgi:hypothetical protein